MDGLFPGYFTSTKLGGGARITSNSRRIAAAGIAATALGLALAVPARADDVPLPVPAPAVPTETILAPTAPDVSAAVVQSGATNVTVTIRIASPGDNGGVVQTIAGAASAASQSTAAPAPSAGAAQQTAPAAVQAAPTNVDVSIRVASPGSDGPVTQTTAVTADAQTQYQTAEPQYQPAAASTSPAESSAPAELTPVAPPVSAAPAPSAWTWNWTWACGDTTAPGITPTLDTGIHGWVWNWNLGGICGSSGPAQSNIAPVIETQSGADIPVVEPPVPPSPPALPEVVAPMLPQPPTESPALNLVEALMPVEEVTPVGPPAATLLTPPELETALTVLPSAAPMTPPGTAARVMPGWRAVASAAIPARRATASKPDAAPRHPRRAQQLVILGVDAPAGGGGGGASGGGSGNGGPGGTAALAPWLLLSFLGYAALRLPAGRRMRRAPVEEIDVRPG